MKPTIRKSDVYKFKSPELEDPEKGIKAVPKKIGDIPELAVLLGMIEKSYWDVYNECAGEKSVGQLAEEFDIEPAFMRIFVDKLYKNGLVEL